MELADDTRLLNSVPAFILKFGSLAKNSSQHPLMHSVDIKPDYIARESIPLDKVA